VSLLDDARLVDAAHKITNARRKPEKHPTGYDLGIDTASGKVAWRSERPIAVDEYDDRFAELLTEWGFDPDLFQLEHDRVEVRTWDSHYGIEQEPKRFWYYKGVVVRKRPKEDLGDLVKRIRSKRSIKAKDYAKLADTTFVVLNADWQLGKQDGGGTEGIIRRVTEAIPKIRERYMDLRKRGHKFNDLLIANLGDLVEGCEGHYPMQTYSVELSRREQVRLARELLTSQLMAWSDDFERVMVVAIPGNHGENRNAAGRTFTNLGDNDDVALVEQVAESFALAESAGSDRYGHVVFRVPDNELTVVLDVSETLVGFTHGHVGNRRANTGKNMAHTKLWDWWYGQAMGKQDVADADMLISGHFHYLSLFAQGGRTALQVPPMDGGSEWFDASTGLSSTAGVATLLIGGGTHGGRAGWDELHIT